MSKVVGMEFVGDKTLLQYDYSDEVHGISYLECNNCLKGPCRHKDMGAVGMCECPIWKESDRADFKKVELNVEVASTLTSHCLYISLGTYQDLEEAEEKQI